MSVAFATQSKMQGRSQTTGLGVFLQSAAVLRPEDGFFIV